MRYAMLVAMLFAAGLATPALAANDHTISNQPTSSEPASAPGWNDCYDLAWIRGVHTEQNELDDFMDQCTAGAVPFGEDFVRHYKRHENTKTRG